MTSQYEKMWSEVEKKSGRGKWKTALDIIDGQNYELEVINKILKDQCRSMRTKIYEITGFSYHNKESAIIEEIEYPKEVKVLEYISIKNSDILIRTKEDYDKMCEKYFNEHKKRYFYHYTYTYWIYKRYFINLMQSMFPHFSKYEIKQVYRDIRKKSLRESQGVIMNNRSERNTRVRLSTSDFKNNLDKYIKSTEYVTRPYKVYEIDFEDKHFIFCQNGDVISNYGIRDYELDEEDDIFILFNKDKTKSIRINIIEILEKIIHNPENKKKLIYKPYKKYAPCPSKDTLIWSD